MSKYGLALDNLLSAEIITAEGKIVEASADEDADLFWAVRGGGGNWRGSVPRISPSSGGPLDYRRPCRLSFDRSKEVLQFYRDVTASLPDELTVFAALVHAPDGTKLTALVLCHCGPLGEGEAATRPIKQFGSPVMDTIGPMPYCELNTMLDAAFPKGRSTIGSRAFSPD